MCFGAAELAILMVMSYDRYVAICHPLHYGTIMAKGACGRMVVASYISAGIYGAMHTAATFSTTFNSNKVHHFFCDIPQIILISDSKMNINEASVTAVSAIILLVCFLSILYSYVHIFSAVSRISSLEGRSKALSTCLTHLAVVTLFLSTGALAYLKPGCEVMSDLDIILSMFYTVVPPSLNPIIYSLRNKDIKVTLGKLLGALTYLKLASELKFTVNMVLSIFYTVVPPSVNPIIYSLRNKDIKIYIQFLLTLEAQHGQPGPGTLAYLKPASEMMSDLDSMLSVFYTVVPPSLNPIIYSLRNRDIKFTLWKVLGITQFKSDQGFGSGELVFLTVMSYDCYEAICCLLQYDSIMNKVACALANIKPASELKSIVDIVLSIFYTVVPPSVNPIIYSLTNKDIKIYIQYLLTLEAQCGPPGPGALANIKPASELKSIVDIVLSIFYTVVPPSVNPIIYSLTNKDIKIYIQYLLTLEAQCGPPGPGQGGETICAPHWPTATICLQYTFIPFLDEMINYTGVTEFLLLGFSDDLRMQTLQGILFLMVYLAALLGNGLNIMLITWDPQLHTPMYFFLKNLSLIDLCYISDTVPKFVLNSLMNRNTISFLGCVFQVLFFVTFAAAELFILTVMSYDRYGAICRPLHYETIMNKGACG
ncbi:Olfactory Receptor 14A16 [Manis pentadactyla]|nr:Olfactory Receptor 14A16 [Manis pentadactyla]